MGVEKAETIWDKIPNDSINFEQFIQVLSNNLLVGIDKNSSARFASLRAEVDNLCWMLCEKSYRQRIRSATLPDSQGRDGSSIDSTEEMMVTIETISGKEFNSDTCFKLWKVNIMLSFFK